MLQGIAYRMLGSLSDAEDIVQDAWLRWSSSPIDRVLSPRSWLVTVVSRLCLDRLKSVKTKRETYYGVWLPDPYLSSDQRHDMHLDESVSIALMLVLEKLTPTERLGFLLHDVFGYNFDEVSAILGKSPEACRKLASRARGQIRDGKPRFEADHREHQIFIARFMDACRKGEIEPLVELLHPDAEFRSDGGGKAITSPRVLDDPFSIAKFFVRVAREHRPSGGFRDTKATFFNGVPGILVYSQGKLVTAIALDVSGERIVRSYAHRNPEKLKFFDA